MSYFLEIAIECKKSGELLASLVISWNVSSMYMFTLGYQNCYLLITW